MNFFLLPVILLFGFLAEAQQTNTEIILAGLKQRDEQRITDKKAQEAKDTIFNHPNASYILSLEALDIVGVRKFADEVVDNAKTKWEFLKIKENEKIGYCRVIYIDTSYSVELKEKIKNGVETCENCLEVNFSLYFYGENKDLEIKGDKRYRFSKVLGKYLDLFPVWQKIFRPDVSIEKTTTDYNSQELVQRTIGVMYKLKKQGEIWTLANYSNYSKPTP